LATQHSYIPLNDIKNETKMKILVLNVDRDNDFGRKANVKSPIIGIKDNVDAANRLGQADPEDSDVNAIFCAISTYNLLNSEGKEVEIATICGDIHVGIRSDEILSHQLETVIKKTGATEVILVTDGAEDEYIQPIIQTRIKITSIRRVAVKQSKNLEDTYYRILKILDDDKVQKQFMLPIGLVLIVWALFVLMGMTASGFGAILFTLGAYILIRVFHWERSIESIFGEIKSGLLTGKLSIYTSIISIVIIIASFTLAITNNDFEIKPEILPILSFMSDVVWGIVVAGLIITFGRVVDTYVTDRKNPWKYWIIFFSLFSFGFISYAMSEAMYGALKNFPNSFDITPFFTATFIGMLSSGVMIAIVGAITYHYIKDMYLMEKEKIEIEKQTSKIFDKN
jgi:putative membrane protein